MELASMSEHNSENQAFGSCSHFLLPKLVLPYLPLEDLVRAPSCILEIGKRSKKKDQSTGCSKGESLIG